MKAVTRSGKKTASKSLRPERTKTLTPKQELFCREYLVDLNASQAAIRCGFSAKTARQQGARLLTNVVIAARVDELRAKQAERLDITADRVLKEWAKIAFSNLMDYFTVLPNGGAVIDLSKMTPEQGAALQELTVDEYMDGGEDGRQVKKIRVKLGDKKGTLDSIARHLGMFTNKDHDPLDKKDVVVVTLAELLRDYRKASR